MLQGIGKIVKRLLIPTIAAWISLWSPGAAGEPTAISRTNSRLSVDEIEPAECTKPAVQPGNSATSPGPSLTPHGARGGRSRGGSGAGTLGEAGSTEEVPEQVLATPMPSFSDGLEGNRQISLSPFPNLNIGSGPLAKHQLPWYHHMPEDSPYSLARATEYQFLGGVFRSNGMQDQSYGLYNSLQAGFPFWQERNVGVQAGLVLEMTTYPDVFGGGSFGFFHRAIWAVDESRYPGLLDRTSAGFVYDGLYDSELRVYIGQVRGQLGYALSPSREVGVWGAIALQNAVTVDPGFPVQVAPSNHGAGYVRQTFSNEMDFTAFLGWAESPGGLFTGAYFDWRVARHVALVLQGSFNFEAHGPRSIYTGVKFYFQPMESYSLIAGNPQNRYRPFLRVIDHINFQMRKTRD